MRGHGVEVIGATQLWPWLLERYRERTQKTTGARGLRELGFRVLWREMSFYEAESEGKMGVESSGSSISIRNDVVNGLSFVVFISQTS